MIYHCLSGVCTVEAIEQGSITHTYTTQAMVQLACTVVKGLAYLRHVVDDAIISLYSPHIILL